MTPTVPLLGPFTAAFGGARTCEWEEPDGRLGLSLALHHPLAGDYAGYEAILAAAAS